MRGLIAVSLVLLVAGFGIVATPSPAQAQATCRQSCMDNENACLKRTGNKGQCGGIAQSCQAKCR